MFKASGICFVSVDAEHKICELSSALAVLLNFTQDELCGLPFMDLITIDVYDAVQDMIDKSLTLYHWMSTAIPLYTKDARKMDVILHAIPYVSKSKLHLVVQPHSGKDFDNSNFWMKANMPALQIDACDTITALNVQMLEFSDFTENDLIGLSFFDLFCKDTLCSVQGMLRRSKGEAGPANCKVCFYTRAAVPKMAQLYALALRDKCGQVFGVSVIIQDLVGDKANFTSSSTADFSTCDFADNILSCVSDESDVEQEW